MSDILKRLAEIETGLLVKLPLSPLGDHSAAREAIHRHTMLVAREVVVDEFRRHAGEIGLGTLFNDSAAHATAALRYPLSPRKVLREEPDPHCSDAVYAYPEGGPMKVRVGGGKWQLLAHFALSFPPTAERIRLWHDLLTNPYREESE